MDITRLSDVAAALKRLIVELQPACEPTASAPTPQLALLVNNAATQARSRC